MFLSSIVNPQQSVLNADMYCIAVFVCDMEVVNPPCLHVNTMSRYYDLSSARYCRPDGTITFDMATSLHRSGTSHDHDQPAHLRLKSNGAVETVNARIYDGPESRYCPAGVDSGRAWTFMSGLRAQYLHSTSQQQLDMLRALLDALNTAAFDD